MKLLRLLFTLALMAAALLISFASRAVEMISFAYVGDPAHEAVVYAIKTGRVRSDLVKVDLKALAVPALLKATGGKQFDVVETSFLSIPDVAAQGVPLTIIGIGQKLVPNSEGMVLWTTADSPIKRIEDLKGRSLGVTGVKSVGTSMIRMTLWKKYGFDVALEGGDVKFVELPSATLQSAVASKQVDATNLPPTQALQARSNKHLRQFGTLSQDVTTVVGKDVIYSVLVSYPERLKQKPEAIKEFLRLLKSSVDYMNQHADEVFQAVAAESKSSPDFFKVFFDRYVYFPVSVTSGDAAAIATSWRLAKELEIIEASAPPIESSVWPGALRLNENHNALSVIIFPGGFNWPLYVAEEKGFFRDRNLEVTLTATPNSAFQMQSLIRGDFQVAMTALDNVVAYDEMQTDTPLQNAPDVVAVSGSDRGFLTLAALPEVKTIKALGGRDVAVDALTTGYAFVLFEMLQRNGVDQNDVSFVKQGGVLERWKGLAEGHSAATLLVTPFDILAKKRGFNLLGTAQSEIGAYQGVVAAVNRLWAREHADVVTRFIRAQIVAMDWLYVPSNREEAIAILRKNVPQLDAQGALESYRVMVAERTGFQPRARIEPEGVRTVLELRSKYAVPKKALNDASRYVDESYYQRALQ